jgi:saccharopine dehydrogenase-like NADP-dependent oxidoreductase
MGDILLDCLPGGQAPRMARFAREHDLHYVNLTEYIKETNEIVEIAKGAETGFILQAGLAPGFVNILAHHLFNEFCNKHQVDKVEKILMRVGALTEHSRSPHFYGFTWSPVGVATEYVKDTVVVRNYEKMNLPALSDREKLIIDGDLYEADLTSGGAADMPDSFEKRARFLDYKTIRYPGHYDWVSEIMKSQHDLDKKIEVLQTAMLKTIPAVEEDLIIIYVSVVGKDKYDRLRAIERSYKILPKSLGGQKMRAIQATTAAPMAECARMLLTGEYRGPVFQSQINPDSFMKGPFVDFVYGSAKREIAIVHGVW